MMLKQKKQKHKVKELSPPKSLSSSHQKLFEQFKEDKSAIKFSLDFAQTYSSKLSKAIAYAVSINTSLVRLDMSASRIGDKGVEDLAEALKVNETLAILNLGFNNLTDASANSLAAALEVNKRLGTLRLEGSAFGSPGIKEIALALKSNETLATLGLGSCKLGDEQVKFLAEALKENSGLTELALSNNEIGNPGAKYLATALRENFTLEKLMLGSNGIGDPGAHEFAEALRENRSFRTLALTRNGLTIAGGRELMDVLGYGVLLSPECVDHSIRKSVVYNQGPHALTEVGRILQESRFEDLTAAFYEAGVRTIEQASKLTRDQMKSIGNTTLAQRKVLLRLFTPKHTQTAVGKLLAANGFDEYSKQFYEDGVRDVVALTRADLKEIGVNTKEHIEALYVLFNDPSSQLKSAARMTSTTGEEGEYEVAIPVAQEDAEEDRADQLMKWHKLYKAGAITEKEFAEEKKKIMEAKE